MSSSKQKKPFLKKGTRQFLSNAQVRSQSTKPRVVDFGVDQQQFVAGPNPILKTRSSQNVDPNYEQIKIKVMPSSTKVLPPSKNQQQIPSKKVDRPPLGRNVEVNSSNKPKREVSIGKKKQAALSDYLDNQSATFNDYSVKKSVTPKQQTKYKKQEQKKFQQQKKPIQKTYQHTQLVQQQLDEEQTPNFIENDSFKPISNPLKNRQHTYALPPSNPAKTSNIKSYKKNNLSGSDNQCDQQVNFVSDKSQDQQYSPQIINHKKNNQNQPIKTISNQIQPKQQKWQEQQDQQHFQSQPVISKVKMNYFNKASNQKNKQVTSMQQIKQKNNKKSLTLNDIPKQLKQQIVKQTIAEKQKQLHQQLQKLRDKFASVKRQKQKLQQDQKAFMKARQQFQKQIQQRNKQFEQKIKSQNSKLARQKKYMKDVQMSGQGDRKYKNQLQQVKKLFDKQKQEKKKIQAKYKVQIQNLRKKLSQQSSKNKLLSQQIKLLQYGQIIQKQQLQEINKEQKKNSVQTFKTGMWADAPQFTYLSRFCEFQFSLIEMDLEKFHYQQNQYFQYYLKHKDTYSPLESQTADPDRVKRQYKNGKVEIQHYKKFVKQVFPFNYTVVNLWNGDIKQTLPQGIVVYFSQNSGATQYCLKVGQIQKQIVYFPNNQTVQMKVVQTNNPSQSYNQVLWRGQLKRISSDGNVTLLKKDPKGKIISL